MKWSKIIGPAVVLALTLWTAEGRAQAPGPSQCVASAYAGGTGDAITIPALPCALTTNLLILTVTHSNTVASPTLQPLGSPALTILRGDGLALTPGDLQVGTRALLNSTGTSWILLNPFWGPYIGFTPSLPVIGAGNGTLAQGTRSGNTTDFGTINGALVSGDCVSIDSNGNLIDAGGVCGGGGGSGTVSAGLAGQPAGYATGGTTVAGFANGQIRVATEAALVALAGGIVNTVGMAGYYAQADGGEGTFDWQGSCLGTPDAGTFVAPTVPVGSGCWARRVYGASPNIRWWGAHCDYDGGLDTGTDDSAIIQTAINWTGAQVASTASLNSGLQGGTLYWPRGCSEGIASPVFQPFSAVTISGMSAPGPIGTGQLPYLCGALLSALDAYSPTSAPLLAVGPLASQYGAGHYALGGANVRNMCFFGNGVAQTGLRIASEFGAVIDSILMYDFTFRPLLVTVANFYNGGHALDGDSNIQNVDFRNLYIDANSIGGPSDGAIVLEAWGNVSNPSLNQFSNLKIIGAGDPCIRIAGADSDNWRNVNCFLATPGNAIIIAANDSGPGTFYGQNESWFGVTTNTSQVVLNANTVDNQFLGYGGNGTPAPECGSGAQASWFFTSLSTIGHC